MDLVAAPRADGSAAEASVAVAGMSCASCVARVEQALKAVPSVTDASVNLATERAHLVFAGEPDLAAVAATVHRAGYQVADETTDLVVEGMSCASCVGRVERALAAVPGVLEAWVNLASGRARVRHLRDVVSLDRLTAAIDATGYVARPVEREGSGADREAERRAHELASLRQAFLLASLLTLPCSCSRWALTWCRRSTIWSWARSACGRAGIFSSR